MEKSDCGNFKKQIMTKQDSIRILNHIRGVFMRHPDLYQELLENHVSLEALVPIIFENPSEAHFIDTDGRYTAYRLNNEYTLDDNLDGYERHMKAIHDYMKDNHISIVFQDPFDFSKLNINADKIKLMELKHFVITKWLSIESMTLHYAMNCTIPLFKQQKQVQNILQKEQIEMAKINDKNEIEQLYSKKLYTLVKGR